jgi:hypothetical protein
MAWVQIPQLTSTFFLLIPDPLTENPELGLLKKDLVEVARSLKDITPKNHLTKHSYVFRPYRQRGDLVA